MTGRAKRIRERRKLLKLTQIELAKRVGVTRSAISQWETKTIAEISGVNLISLAEALGATPEWIITGISATNYPQPTKSIENVKVKEQHESPPYQDDKTSKGLCPQTEDERIMLEKYRQLTPDQRTQMQAIGDTFTQQIALKKSG